MLEIKETQNYIRIGCTECNGYTIDQIDQILDDMNINANNIRSCAFTLWKDVSHDSDGTYRYVKEFRINESTKNWRSLLQEALERSRNYSNPEVTGHILCKKADPMKTIVDNVNFNLETLRDKLEKEL